MRRDDRQIARIRLRECRVRGFRKIEVRTTVVDEIDALAIVTQYSGFNGELARIDDDCAKAMRFEQRFEQQELEMEILLAWRVIDDGDGAELFFAARQTPLVHEHRDDGACALFGRWLHAEELGDLVATRLLR